MKNFVALISFLCSCYVVAQPSTWKQPYEPPQDLKANQYISKAKGFLKRGNYFSTAYHAALALSRAQKKGQIIKAQDLLKQSYDRSIEDKLYEIETLEEKPEVYAGHETANNRQKIWRLYRELRNINRILTRTPQENFRAQKRKDRSLFLQIKDYSTQAKQAQANFKTSKAKTAETFYQVGLESRENEDLQSQRTAAKAFKMATQYVSDYKEASTLYQECRENAITRLGVSEFSSSTQAQQYGELGSEVSDKLLTSFLSKGKSQFEFFELISRDQLDRILEEQKVSVSGLFDENSTVELGNLKGVHYLLVGKITSAETTREKNEPKTETVEREVVVKREKYKDENGKEQTRDVRGTVTAKVTTYEKHATGIIKGSYKIISVKTGTIHTIKSFKGESYFQNMWATFSGDKRALSSKSVLASLFGDDKVSQKKLVEQKEKPFPSNSRLLSYAIDNMLQDIVGQLNAFAREVGQ